MPTNIADANASPGHPFEPLFREREAEHDEQIWHDETSERSSETCSLENETRLASLVASFALRFRLRCSGKWLR